MKSSNKQDAFSPGILYILETLVFSFGQDEDDMGQHLEDHKNEKLHRLNKLVRGKRHLAGVHLDRVALQWETHVWLRNLLVMETLPVEVVDHLMTWVDKELTRIIVIVTTCACVSMSTHRYSEVRIAAQDILLKVLQRLGPVCHPLVLPQLVACLTNTQHHHQDSEEVESRLKGALYIIYAEKHLFFYSWEAASMLWPALVTAQQSDKQSEWLGGCELPT